MQYSTDNPKLKTAIEQAMRESGRMGKRHKLKIISISGDPGSNYVRVECHLHGARSSKPFMYWNLCVNMAKSLIYWEHSTFYQIR